MTTTTEDITEKFLSLAEKIDTPTICDIGSRDALEGLFLFHRLCSKALHVFEPNPEAIARCKANIGEQSNVTLNEVGLSDTQGPLEFYPVDSESSERKDIGLSSMYRVNPKYTKRRGRTQQTTITIQATTLDDYFLNKAAPEILWVDAEGAELRIFQGGTRVLKNVHLIQVEVGFRPMHIGKPLFWEVDEFLKAHGFQLCGFAEFSRLKGWLYRNRLLPNLPWRANAIYRRLGTALGAQSHTAPQLNRG